MAGPSYAGSAQSSILLISDEDRQGREAYIFLMGEGASVSKPERIETAKLDAPGAPVWIELTQAAPETEAWLQHLGEALSGVPATVVVPEAMLDVAAARLDGADVEILVEPETAERLTALALMRAREAVMQSGAREANEAGVGADIERLSQEVARIASSLAMLTEKAGPGVKAIDASPPGKKIDAKAVRDAILARRRRFDFFDAALFSDPAWDMLLELTEADLAGQQVPISSLCMAAAVPPTTALRWIRTMTERGIFKRRPDAHDGRRVFIELAADARTAMHGYFAEAPGAASA